MSLSCHRFLPRALLASVLFLMSAVPQAAPAPAAAPEPVATELRARLAGGAPESVAGEVLRERALVARFYATRAGKPAWIDTAEGRYRALDALLAAVAKAPEDGLDADDYHRTPLAAALEAVRRGRTDTAALATLDVLATDAWLALAHDLLSGRLDPQQLDKDWTLRPRNRDLVAALNEALAGRRDVAGELAPWPGHFPLELDHSGDSLNDILVRGQSVSEHLAAGLWDEAEAYVLERFGAELSESTRRVIARSSAASSASDAAG